MGYFALGHLILSKPKWERLSKLPPELAWRGYEHDGGQFWLMETWDANEPAPDGLFSRGRKLDALVWESEDNAVGTYAELMNVLAKRGYEVYGQGWIGLSLEIARLLGQPVLTFVGDDEFFDLACQAEPNGVERIRARLDNLVLTLGRETVTIQPYYPEVPGIEEQRWDDELLDELRTRFNAEILEPVDVDRGFPFYGSLLDEWPQAIGDPEELLGVGTCEPFAYLGEHFRHVAGEKRAEPLEKAPAQPPPRPVHRAPAAAEPEQQAQWWQFWKPSASRTAHLPRPEELFDLSSLSREEEEAIRSLNKARSRAMRWDRQNECNELGGVVLSLLRHAVTHCAGPEEAGAYLRSRRMVTILQRREKLLAGWFRKIKPRLRRGRGPGKFHRSFYPEDYKAAWLLGEFELGNSFLDMVSDEDYVRSQGRGFWADFERATASFAKNQPFDPKTSEAGGVLETFPSLVQLMAAIANGGDVGAALAAAKEACKTRNADERFESDVLNGGSPAQWDLKLEAILAYARVVYALQL